jgi:hypothetical protein
MYNVFKQEKQRTHNVTLRRIREPLCHGKAMSITYSKCVSIVLLIKHAKRMYRLMRRVRKIAKSDY